MIIKTKLTPILLVAIFMLFSIFTVTYVSLNSSDSPTLNNVVLTANYCGVGSGQVQTSINWGCHGNACPGGEVAPDCKYHAISSIADLLFSVIRFLSAGVGLVIVASMTYAGIQYIGSRGEPQATEAAMNRIRANIIALILYIFTYAILAYVIPPGYLV